MIAPLALRLPQDYLVTLMTEVDALKDSANRREANFINLIGVSHPLPGVEGANATVELFSAVGSDRATPPIYTFDLGMNFRIDQHTILMSASTSASTTPRRKCRFTPAYPPAFDGRAASRVAACSSQVRLQFGTQSIIGGGLSAFAPVTRLSNPGKCS